MVIRCPNQMQNGPMHSIFIGNPFRQEEEFKCHTCGLKFDVPTMKTTRSAEDIFVRHAALSAKNGRIMMASTIASTAERNGGMMPKPTLIEWLRERYENCLRHARQKPGWDRDGWLEDAAYFKEALDRLNAGNPNYTPYQVEAAKKP